MKHEDRKRSAEEIAFEEQEEEPTLQFTQRIYRTAVSEAAGHAHRSWFTLCGEVDELKAYSQRHNAKCSIFVHDIRDINHKLASLQINNLTELRQGNKKVAQEQLSINGEIAYLRDLVDNLTESNGQLQTEVINLSNRVQILETVISKHLKVPVNQFIAIKEEDDE